MKEVFAGQASQKSQLVGLSHTVDEDVIDFGQYWRIVMRSKLLIILVTVLCLLTGGYTAIQMIPMYKASATILADPQKPTAGLGQGNIPGNNVALFYDTQYEIINSRNIAESVVDKLGLVERYKNSEKGKSEQLLLEKPLSDDDLRLKLALEIQDNLNVSGGRSSQIISISYASEDPANAAAVVNTIAESYIQFGLASRLVEVKNTENWLSEQSASLKATLRESETRLSQYRSQEGLVDTQQQQNLVNNQLQSLNNALINAQTRFSTSQEQYLAIKNVDAGAKELYSLGPVLDNPATRDLVREQGRLSQRVNELFERYGEKHPTMIAARSELKSVTENLATEVSKVVNSIEKDYRLAQVQVSNIQNLIAQTKENIQSLQTENFSLVSLERDVENNRRIYENFQVSLLETSGISDYNASNVSIIDSATIPKLPYEPNIKFILVISAVFGLILGVFVAFMRESFNYTLKTPDDIEEKLSVHAIGISPVVKVKRKGPTPEQQYLNDSLTIFSESINTIRTGLLFSNIDKPPQTLLVTSASHSEGKSTLAVNLAAAFSQLGKTLLLEVDLRKPSFARTFGYNSTLGLTDLVLGSVEISQDIMHFENKNRLNIISCGTIIRNPLELLSSNKFDEILNLLKGSYKYIILDGPPTLPVSDSCILANKVDGVIFAVKAEQTKVKMAKESISRLQKLNANVIGAVLTVADPKKISDYGEHFYSNEFYGEEQPSQEKIKKAANS